jgi:hypothetical protein
MRCGALAATSVERRAGRRFVQRCASRSARFAIASDATFVHPFDDADVIAGQATVALGTAGATSRAACMRYSCLWAAAACWRASRPDQSTTTGCTRDRRAGERCGRDGARARCKGERIALDDVGLFADGTAVKQVGALTFSLCQQYVDDMLTRGYRRDLRSYPRHLPGHAQRAGTRRRVGPGRPEAIRRHAWPMRWRTRCHRFRRQHEFRSPALRRRACGSRRAARGGVRRDDSRAARQLSSLLRTRWASMRSPSSTTVSAMHAQHISL